MQTSQETEYRQTCRHKQFLVSSNMQRCFFGSFFVRLELSKHLASHNQGYSQKQIISSGLVGILWHWIQVYLVLNQIWNSYARPTLWSSGSVLMTNDAFSWVLGESQDNSFNTQRTWHWNQRLFVVLQKIQAQDNRLQPPHTLIMDFTMTWHMLGLGVHILGLCH